MIKSSKATREERERLVKLKHKLDTRISVAKIGKEALDGGDYANAVKRFVDYLSTIAEVKEVTGIYALRTSHFNPQKDLTEMLMISHIYFEMARMYDAVPQFHDEAKKCLEQFVHFSANQPFQVVNSEMLRKYLKKSQFKNPEAFRFAYQQIYVQSKKCYVVTFCYGTDHVVTNDFRELKDRLLDTHLGFAFVSAYYRHSSRLVERYADARPMKFLAQFVLRPLLYVFSKTLLKVILKS